VEFRNSDDGIAVKIKPHCTQRDIALFIATLCNDDAEMREVILSVASKSEQLK
jgi:hypothetical protein